MRSLALALASVALLAGTPAAAQDVFNIQASAGSSYFTPNFEGGFDETPVPGGQGRFPPGGGTGGAIYNSFVNIGATSIFFESSNVTSQGNFSSFSSFSELSFEIETGSEFNFHSQITPQGLGMYLADTSGGCLFTNSCAQVSDEDYQFQQLTALDTEGVLLGGMGFSFEILDNGNSLYSLSGQVLLTDGLGPCDGGVCFLDGMGAAAGALDGFSLQTDVNDNSAIAYGWGATDLSFGMGAGVHNITYRTSVFTFTNANCLDGTVCLVAYSGFGDPIGRGGGIASAAAPFGGDFGAFDHGFGDLIQGLTFTPQVFALPQFDVNGDLVYAPAQGGVPEPTTWALMILGFGAMGAALRRRRIPAHI